MNLSHTHMPRTMAMGGKRISRNSQIQHRDVASRTRAVTMGVSKIEKSTQYMISPPMTISVGRWITRALAEGLTDRPKQKLLLAASPGRPRYGAVAWLL
jgi:hypothetical protein